MMVDSKPSMNAIGMTGTSRARLINVQLVDLDLFSGLSTGMNILVVYRPKSYFNVSGSEA